MSVHNVQIIFDKPTAIFALGQIIIGRVLIDADNPVKMRSK